MAKFYLHDKRVAGFVSTGAFTRWIRQQLESRMIRHSRTLADYFVTYESRGLALGVPIPKSSCACTTAEASQSNGSPSGA